MTLESLIIAAGGAWLAILLFMAAMAGRMNQLSKTYRAQLRYDFKKEEIAILKEKRNKKVFNNLEETEDYEELELVS